MGRSTTCVPDTARGCPGAGTAISPHRVGDGPRTSGQRDEEAAGHAFPDTVVIRFGVAVPDRHHHVPPLVSPFACSTYRGS